MDDPSPQREQSLLHIGRLKAQLEALAAKDGQRWQDLARQILSDYVAAHRDA